MDNITQLVKDNSDMGPEKLIVVEQLLATVPHGIYLEVGTRMGGTALLTLSMMDESSLLICVDPYGNRTYSDRDTATATSFTDNMYLSTIERLSNYCIQSNKSFQHFKMTSEEFLSGEFNIYDRGEKQLAQNYDYDYVLLDGDHSDDTVAYETTILRDRMQPGGVVLIDNFDWLSGELKAKLVTQGYVVVRDGDMAYKRF